MPRNNASRAARLTVWISLAILPALTAGPEHHTGISEGGWNAHPVVITSSGRMAGDDAGDIHIFKGIPYAAPPVGKDRWKAPREPNRWTETLFATNFGAACPQKLSALPQSTPQSSSEFFGPVGRLNEDCLSLNVWTPSSFSREKFPVMFWIFGGGFHVGSASQPMYDGTHLSKKGMVVVTINYRIGPLGFLAHPELTAESSDGSSGNQGMLDMAAALRWVNRNIAAFGGDPENVTIIGQSVGANSVYALMTSPLARGMFHRAIIHSGPMPRNLRALRQARGELAGMESLGQEYARILLGREVARPLAAMRAKPWPEVIRAHLPSTGVAGSGTLDSMGAYPPFLEENPSFQFSTGRQVRVPLLICTVKDEGTLFEYAAKLESLERYHQLMEATFGAAAPQALKFYPAANLASAKQAYTRMQTDAMVATSRDFARWMSAVEPRTWRCEFAREPRSEAASWRKCFHGSEIAYLFGNFPKGMDYTAADHRLSEQMMDYWVQFMRTGNPNHKGAPEWPAWREESDPRLILDVPIRTGTHLRREACDLWDQWMPPPRRSFEKD